MRTFMVLLPQISPRILLKHRALRGPIEDLARRFDHPFLATEARYYESIQLNKKLRAASAWRSESRGVMWVSVGSSNKIARSDKVYRDFGWCVGV